MSVNNGAADMESPNNINNSPFATETVWNMQVLESTVDACKVVEACLTCTDLRFQMVLVMSVTIIMLLVMDHQVRVVQAGLTWWW